MTTRLEKNIMRRLLTEEITFEQGQRALADPQAFKLSRRMEGGRHMNYRYWGKIKTSRMRVAYCWSTRRNEAGYFLGWREHYNEEGVLIKRDQWSAQKVKVRLKERQLRRSKALLDDGAKASKKTTALINDQFEKLIKSDTME